MDDLGYPHFRKLPSADSGRSKTNLLHQIQPNPTKILRVQIVMQKRDPFSSHLNLNPLSRECENAHVSNLSESIGILTTQERTNSTSHLQNIKEIPRTTKDRETPVLVLGGSSQNPSCSEISCPTPENHGLHPGSWGSRHLQEAQS